MTERALCVLVTGEPVATVREKHGEFSRFFQRAIGDAWGGAWASVDARSEDLSKRDLTGYAGVIVTGSPASVTERAPWILAAEESLRTLVAKEVPLLGVCFGHQLLASALGGEVQKNPAGRRLGTHEVRVRRQPDALFDGLPEAFSVNVSHEDHVARRPVGPSIAHLASAGHDDFHAFRAGRRAWGVQFHPEFDASITEGYVHARRALLAQSGLDPDAILQGLRGTPEGPRLLQNFVRVVKNQ